MIASILGHSTGTHSPLLFVAGVAAAGVYIWTAGAPRIRKGSGRRRSRVSRRMLFLAAMLTLIVAFFGPVDRLSEALFWVHMVQHVLLLMVAAPLLVLSAPWIDLLRIVPLKARRRFFMWTRQQRSNTWWLVPMFVATPAAAWTLFNLNLLAWHVPVLFDLTLQNTGAHLLEHLLFLATGVLFWSQMIDAPMRRIRMDNLTRVVYVAGAATVGWILSIALTVAPAALYSGYARAAGRPGGLSALADQRIAASVMLVPGSVTFLIAGLVYIHRWLDDETGTPHE